MPFLFAITIFVSAVLLFVVELMVGKMILPLLGGTPNVWITCMLFFQVVLLIGYSYAHLITHVLRPRAQVLLHGLLLFIPLIVLPISIARTGAEDWNPSLWLLTLLAMSVGLPFFILSTSAPLLQKWFSTTDHASAKDPYFLYSASNLGSMIALLSYPSLVEPWLPLRSSSWLAQNYLWALGYGLLILLVLGCGWVVWRSAGKRTEAGYESGGPTSEAEVWEELRARPTIGQRLYWIALAFVPSSLMLGVTNHITLDIAAVPLLWIIPLTLYLLSFILVFARWPLVVHRAILLIMPLFVLLLIFTMIGEIKLPITATIGLHLLAFFLVALAFHGELARRRPSTSYLTEFYLLMSLGGVLGGLFNAIVAPMAFKTILEYPIAMVLACLFLPRWDPDDKPWLTRLFPKVFPKPVGFVLDVITPLVLGLCAYGLAWFLTGEKLDDAFLEHQRDRVLNALKWLATPRGDDDYSVDRYVRLRSIVVYGLPVLLCYACVPRPLRFGLCVAALFLAGAAWDASHEKAGQREVVFRDRNFYGMLTVKRAVDDEGVETYSLLHGDIMHGEQIRAPFLQDEPITYYHRTGPIGQLFSSFQGPFAKHNLAVIGLGTGTMSCYSAPDRRVTFYDINPAVVRIAQNPNYFTYWHDCKPTPRLIMGDARLKLEEAGDGEYDVMVVDAFSSDAIPIHLITREAVELDFRKLAQGGVLMVHISNRYLDLKPVLANIAADLGLYAMVEYDTNEDAVGKSSSEWVVLVRKREDLGWLATDNRWDQFVQALGVEISVDERGCKVGGIDPGSTAERLHLKTGDMILQVNGKEVKTAAQLRVALPAMGEPVEIVFRRHIPESPPETLTSQGVMKPSLVGVWTDDYSNLLRVFSW